MDRIFSLESDQGCLINPKDGSRNVSFKVQTFQRLMQGFENGILPYIRDDVKLHSDQKDKAANGGCVPKWLDETLRSAGRLCGSAFAESVLDSWIEQAGLDASSMIHKWCEFDSDVGLGRLVLDAGSCTFKERRLIECRIILYNSYLTPGSDIHFRAARDHRYCGLMTGYIQGMLARILQQSDEQVIVEHSAVATDESTQTKNPIEFRSESCQFNVCVGHVGESPRGISV